MRARLVDTAVDASWGWLTPRMESGLRFHAGRVGVAAGLDADDLFQEAVLYLAVRHGKGSARIAVLEVAKRMTAANTRNGNVPYGDLDDLADL